TTDEPIASLEYHKRIKTQGTSPKVFPTFRPDKAFAIEGGKDYMAYMALLSEASGISIDTYEGLLTALENRIDYFHTHGCRLADHGLEQLYCYQEGDFSSEDIFLKVREGRTISLDEVRYFKARILLFLGKTYHNKGWA